MVYLLPARRNSDLTFTDALCGCGGSSEGLRWLGLRLVLAVNHDPRALATHSANFRGVPHLCEDITAIQEDRIKQLPESDFAWISGECKYQSNSSGVPLLNQNQLRLWTDDDEKPYIERSRATMREVVRWAAIRKGQGRSFRALIVENVPKTNHWSGFLQWKQDLIDLDYEVQTFCFNSMFAQAALPPDLALQVYPIAQSRDRWYAVCTQKGNPLPDVDFRPRAHCYRCATQVEAGQTWKPRARARKWGDYGRQYVYTCPRCHEEVVPYYTLAWAMIDWSIPIKRVGERRHGLAETTVSRVQKGLQRFCGQGDHTAFLMETCRNKSEGAHARPLRLASYTQTTAQSLGIVVPPCDTAERPFTFHTLRTSSEVERQINRMGLSGVEELRFREQYGWEVKRYQQELRRYISSYMDYPPPPPEAENAFIASYYNGSDVLHPVTEAVYTCTTVDRHGLVIPPWGVALQDVPPIEECLYRTLRSKEVKRAQGIPEWYEIVATTQREETRQCGLAVNPAVAALITSRVLPSLGERAVLRNCS